MVKQFELFPCVLEEASKLIDGDRQDAYGSAAENFTCTARMWSAYLSVACGLERELTPKDISHLMALLKIARLAKSPGHRDSVVDGIGYLALSDRVA
jgi:hypothetical protein